MAIMIWSLEYKLNSLIFSFENNNVTSRVRATIGQHVMSHRHITYHRHDMTRHVSRFDKIEIKEQNCIHPRKKVQALCALLAKRLFIGSLSIFPLFGHQSVRMSSHSSPMKVVAAEKLMNDFKIRTGLTSSCNLNEKQTEDTPKEASSSSTVLPKRYLWTDAFAVLNFMELYKQTNHEEYKDNAIDLINQVHLILGSYRKDDKLKRKGWLSGLSYKEGFKHPTCSGLRIGKDLPERLQDERGDDSMEWVQDGQYFHYLTKWTHTLNVMSKLTGDEKYNIWAHELIKGVHSKFVYKLGAPSQLYREAARHTHNGNGRELHPGIRMYWKMSTDLSFPLVKSMGMHDPLDGLVTYFQVQATSPVAHVEKSASEVKKTVLDDEIADMKSMCSDRDASWPTTDALGIGGLCMDAFRLMQLIEVTEDDDTLNDLNTILMRVVDALEISFDHFAREHPFNSPPHHRLAFRELGLCIGLHAISFMVRHVKSIEEQGDGKDKFQRFVRLKSQLNSIFKYMPMAATVEGFWLKPSHQQCQSWLAHEDINSVMLATCLVPSGFLTL